MGFSIGNFAKIQQIDNKSNYTNCKITISKREKKTNNFVCVFSGWVKFIGQAHLCRPQVGQKIKITSCDVTNGYLDADGMQKWNNKPQFVIFTYELQNNENNSSSNGNSPIMDFADLGADTDLPF